MRRCRYEPTRSDLYDVDVVQRLRGLLSIVRLPPGIGPAAVRRDAELLDQLVLPGPGTTTAACERRPVEHAGRSPLSSWWRSPAGVRGQDLL
ncbi:hypothetical protein ACQHIV_42300 (plasmid) [Kribbella sp. GL6]|uniref:hypothetical protein n=1 Tax=Kribbella sp. GL6 TaxID=3419765 RepID=UPI003D0218AD